MGLGYKLVVAPLLILVLSAGLIGLRGRTTEVTLFEAAMPPQIGRSIVAIQYGLDARLISLMVGIGTVAAFLTLPAWWRAFEFL
jgi:predicted permease